jgi:hypothetical protein
MVPRDRIDRLRRRWYPRPVKSTASRACGSVCAIAAAGALSACATAEPYVLPADLRSPYAGYVSPRYEDPARWVCRPDLAGSPCARDRTATEIASDGTRRPVTSAAPAEPAADCFYVYPTVDLSLLAYNHDDFSDTRRMADVTYAQAASFAEGCRVFAPLYRQVTIGTYLRSAETREHGLEVAFSDVADAFLHYWSQDNHGRPVALIGHSQGADMIVRLLKTYFDGDPALRERLLVAMPIGGHVEVKKGAAAGGTFQNIPLCTSPDQRACVIAYRSHRGSDEVSPNAADLPAPGHEIACVNPADVATNQRRPLSRTIVPLSPRLKEYFGDALGDMTDVQTPMLMVRGFYSAQCLDGKDGYRYLGIWPSDAPGDARAKPFALTSWRFGTSFGLHVLDFQLPEGDLVDHVTRRAAAAKP